MLVAARANDCTANKPKSPRHQHLESLHLLLVMSISFSFHQLESFLPLKQKKEGAHRHHSDGVTKWPVIVCRDNACMDDVVVFALAKPKMQHGKQEETESSNTSTSNNPRLVKQFLVHSRLYMILCFALLYLRLSHLPTSSIHIAEPCFSCSIWQYKYDQ